MRLDVGFRILPAGAERLRRAATRGHEEDDPALPARELTLSRGGRALTVWIGPIDQGDPDAELWELDAEIR